METVGQALEIGLRVRLDQAELVADNAVEGGARTLRLAEQQTRQLVGLVQKLLRHPDIDHQHVGHELGLRMQRRQCRAAAGLG